MSLLILLRHSVEIPQKIKSSKYDLKWSARLWDVQFSIFNRKYIKNLFIFIKNLNIKMISFCCQETCARSRWQIALWRRWRIWQERWGCRKMGACSVGAIQAAAVCTTGISISEPKLQAHPDGHSSPELAAFAKKVGGYRNCHRDEEADSAGIGRRTTVDARALPSRCVRNWYCGMLTHAVPARRRR